MIISDEQLETFRLLYKNRFRKEIAKEEAYKQAIKLICLMKCIYIPMTVEAYEEFKRERIKDLPEIIAEIASEYTDSII